MAARKSRNTSDKKSTAEAPPTSNQVIDIGGTSVKIMADGHTRHRKFPSGKDLKPDVMVKTVRKLADKWKYEAVSIGFPGIVGPHGPRSEPGNLGSGWVGFDYAAAFEKPVRILNDAAMQALGSYEGGRMLFIGLGTSLGSTLIAGGVLVPLELGTILVGDGIRLADIAGAAGLERLGKKQWRRLLREHLAHLIDAFTADYMVIGGGNARKLKEPPSGARLGHNRAAYRGGIRLWNIEDIPTHTSDGGMLSTPAVLGDWKLI